MREASVGVAVTCGNDPDSRWWSALLLGVRRPKIREGAPWTRAIVPTLLVLCAAYGAAPARAGYVAIYGGPAYDPTSGDGFQNFTVPRNYFGMNNAGVAVGSAHEFVGRSDPGARGAVGQRQHEPDGAGHPRRRFARPKPCGRARIERRGHHRRLRRRLRRPHRSRPAARAVGRGHHGRGRTWRPRTHRIGRDHG